MDPSKYIILLIVLIGKTFCAEIGDSCIAHDDTDGECKLITKCTTGLNLILKGTLPKICGYNTTVPIICCKKETLILPLANRSSNDTIVFPAEAFESVPVTVRKPGGVSAAKCKEYAEHAFEWFTPPVLLLDPPKLKKRQCESIATPLVVGGEEAKQGEFPHMVQLGRSAEPNGFENWCGGSLISENFILTAAHCFKHSKWGNPTHAALGLTNSNDPLRQIVEVVRTFPHSDYDIGLVQIKGANINPTVRPACLNIDSNIETTLIATGWGIVGYQGKPSPNLLKVSVEPFKNDECDGMYNNLNSSLHIGSHQICAGSKTEKKDTCKGDSGGPLQKHHDSSEDNAKCMFDIVGVTSFGRPCGKFLGSPGVYTRVSYFIKWIEDIVWPETLPAIYSRFL